MLIGGAGSPIESAAAISGAQLYEVLREALRDLFGRK